MAKVMEYTDEFGATHPNSYWLLDEFHFKASAKIGQFTFLGWHDQAAAVTGKPSIKSVTYEVRGSDFDYYFTRHMVDGLNIRDVGYEVASEKPVATGQMVENANNVMVPEMALFFQEATDV